MQEAQPRAGAEESAGTAADPPGGPPRRLRLKLTRIQDVTRELSRVYREARARRIDVADASRLANILSIIGRLIADGDLEARVQALEAALGGEGAVSGARGAGAGARSGR